MRLDDADLDHRLSHRLLFHADGRGFKFLLEDLLLERNLLCRALDADRLLEGLNILVGSLARNLNVVVTPVIPLAISKQLLLKRKLAPRLDDVRDGAATVLLGFVKVEADALGSVVA